MLPLVTFYYSRKSPFKLLISDFSGEITQYYIRLKTSLLIQLITCFYYSYSIGNPFSSLLINDVTQLFLLRLAKESERISYAQTRRQ